MNIYGISHSSRLHHTGDMNKKNVMNKTMNKMKHNLINRLSNSTTIIGNSTLTIWTNLITLMTICLSIHLRNFISKKTQCHSERSDLSRVLAKRESEESKKNKKRFFVAQLLRMTNNKPQKSTQSSTLIIYMIFVMNIFKNSIHNNCRSLLDSKNRICYMTQKPS